MGINITNSIRIFMQISSYVRKFLIPLELLPKSDYFKYFFMFF